MNTVDKLLFNPKKFTSLVIFAFCMFGLVIMLLAALVVTEREGDKLIAQAAALRDQLEAQELIILEQQLVINAYEEQQAAVLAVLDQATETLFAIANGPYTREEVSDLVQQVAEVIREVNKTLTTEQVDEISQVVVTQALAADIDPWLLVSMAITESHFRPAVRGGSGEYGMLQVMPGTGRWIAGRMGYSEWVPEQLFDFRTNVQYAAFYLRISIREFGGDTIRGVLAYNRGGRGAREWMAEHCPGDHRYVRKVMTTYRQLTAG